MFQEQLSACFKNACPDNKRLRVRIIQESCPDVTRIISKGWSAYIDGEKTELLKADYGLTTMLVPEGEHKIVLKYTTPGIRLGVVCSFLGVLIAFLMMISGNRFKQEVVG